MSGKDLEFILRVLTIVSDVDRCDDIWWRTDGEYAPVTFLMNCNDLFWWGCSDCEEVTPENVEMLAQAYVDVEAAISTTEWSTAETPQRNRDMSISWDKSSIKGYAGTLFCARVRKMRPQGACYRGMDPRIAKLFDECGPEREVDFGNPKSQHETKPTVVSDSCGDGCTPVPVDESRGATTRLLAYLRGLVQRLVARVSGMDFHSR